MFKTKLGRYISYYGNRENIVATSNMYNGINTLDDLFGILLECWCKETAYPICQKDYEYENDPTYGQCAITAMIVNDMKTIELIKQIITDLNNKELRDYPNCAEVYIYASKENIDKIQKNNIEKHIYNQEYIIQRYMNECENLRNQVYDLQEDIIRYKEEIDNLNDTIREYQMSE